MVYIEKHSKGLCVRGWWKRKPNGKCTHLPGQIRKVLWARKSQN